MFPINTGDYPENGSRVHSVNSAKRVHPVCATAFDVNAANLVYLFLRQLRRPMTFSSGLRTVCNLVGIVALWRIPAKVVNRVIATVAVVMTSLLAGRPIRHERLKNKVMDVFSMRFSVSPKRDKPVANSSFCRAKLSPVRVFVYEPLNATRPRRSVTCDGIARILFQGYYPNAAELRKWRNGGFATMLRYSHDGLQKVRYDQGEHRLTPIVSPASFYPRPNQTPIQSPYHLESRV